jgi:hypothetical protein
MYPRFKVVISIQEAENRDEQGSEAGKQGVKLFPRPARSLGSGRRSFIRHITSLIK